MENLTHSPNHILAMWHRENLPAFCADIFRITHSPFCLLNHPTWYMKPIHLVLFRLGVKQLVLGSTGFNGVKAADRVIEKLAQKFSTFINPDGPAGPPHLLRKGVLHMARQSGVPVIPVQIRVSHEWVAFWTWDGKRYPLPGSRIVVQVGAPLNVNHENFDFLVTELPKLLGSPRARK